MSTPKQKYNGPMKKVGDELDWTSQASGYAKRKTGKILAVVKPDEDVFRVLRKLGIPTSTRYVMGKATSGQDRYLVRTQLGSDPPLYYLPGCKAIDRGIAAGKKPKDAKRPEKRAA